MFLNKRKFTFPIASFLKIDMHAHFLPGLDDGAKNIDESLQLIAGMKAMGYQKLIATPHIMADLYPNNKETIQAAYHQVKKEMAQTKCKIPISYAAEYLIDEEFPKKIEEGLLCIDKRYVLIETMFPALPPNIEDILFSLRTHKYTPILAHPERYHYMNKDLKALDIFLKHGCKLQPNLLSFSGYYGKIAKELAHDILDADLIDFLGTDIHNKRHLNVLENFRIEKKIAEKLEMVSDKHQKAFH